MNEKRLRRKRINRIKTGIVLVIAGINLFCIVTCIVLAVRLHSVQAQLDIITENIIFSLDSSSKALDGTMSEAGELTVGDASGAAVDEEDVSDESLDISDLLLEKVKEHIDPSENVYQEGDVRKVYLTFDDGPSTNTINILDILDEYGVKATFFVNGKESEQLEPLYKEITDRGHTIGMHSYTHNYLQVYDSVRSFAADYNKIYDLIYEKTGVEPEFYRFPGGSSNHVSASDMDELIRFLGARGIVYHDWNVMSGDATTAAYTSDDLVNNVIKDVKKYKCSVVLMHDAADKDKTVAALPVILDELNEMGCEILPITTDSPVIHHI